MQMFRLCTVMYCKYYIYIYIYIYIYVCVLSSAQLMELIKDNAFEGNHLFGPEEVRGSPEHPKDY